MLKHVPSVIEVNVGIICACSLTLPAFIERHGLHDFGSSVTRLIPSLSYRRRGQSTGTYKTEGHSQTVRGSQGNYSDDIELDDHEHSELNERDRVRTTKYSMTGKVSDHQYSPTFKANISNEDVEVWPGNTREPADVLLLQSRAVPKLSSP